MTARSIRRAIERKRLKDARKGAKKSRSAASVQAVHLSPERFGQPDEPAFLSEAKIQGGAGLTGRTVLLPRDCAEDYARHVAGYQAQYQPVTQRELDLVQSIADTAWRLKRIPLIEYALYARGQAEYLVPNPMPPGSAPSQPASPDPDYDLMGPLSELYAHLLYEKELRNLHLQESRLSRRQARELAELTNLQAERRRHEQTELNEAADLYEAAQAAGTPFDPAELGFEFSIPLIKRHIALRHAPKSSHTRPPTSNFPASEAANPATQAA